MRGEWYQGGEGNENERRYRINRRGVEYDYEEYMLSIFDGQLASHKTRDSIKNFLFNSQ